MRKQNLILALLDIITHNRLRKKPETNVKVDIEQKIIVVTINIDSQQ